MKESCQNTMLHVANGTSKDSSHAKMCYGLEKNGQTKVE